jgi:hypothetical protein
MLHRFTEVLGRNAREQLLQLLPHFLESFLHWMNFKLTADATAITFSQLLERAMGGISISMQIFKNSTNNYQVH